MSPIDRTLNIRNRCLNPRCKRQARARGLCSTCYSAALRNVYKGNFTWAQLEEIGKALPPRPRSGGTSVDWLRDGASPDEQTTVNTLGFADLPE